MARIENVDFIDPSVWWIRSPLRRASLLFLLILMGHALECNVHQFPRHRLELLVRRQRHVSIPSSRSTSRLVRAPPTELHVDDSRLYQFEPGLDRQPLRLPAGQGQLTGIALADFHTGRADCSATEQPAGSPVGATPRTQVPHGRGEFGLVLYMYNRQRRVGELH